MADGPSKSHSRDGADRRCGRESIGRQFGHNGLALKAKVLCRSAGHTSNVRGKAAEPHLFEYHAGGPVTCLHEF